MSENIEFAEEGDDVMARIKDEETGNTVTILTAPRAALGEDGPVVTQISSDQVLVVYADEYVRYKMETALENNGDEFGEGLAASMAFAFIINGAMKVAVERFLTKE